MRSVAGLWEASAAAAIRRTCCSRSATGASGCTRTERAGGRSPRPTSCGKDAVEAWQRRHREEWHSFQGWRERTLGELQAKTSREWKQLYHRQDHRAETLERLGRGGIAGRMRAASIGADGKWDRLEDTPEKKKRGAGVLQAVRDARRLGWREAWKTGRDAGGLQQVREALDQHHRTERVQLGKEHSAAAGRIEIELAPEARAADAAAEQDGRYMQAAPRRKMVQRAASRTPPSPTRTPQPGPERGGRGFER